MRSLILLFTGILTLVAQDTWQSDIVYYNTENRLQYVRDTEGNQIPDFSYAGYKNGMTEIPEVTVVKTIGPVEGDNTAHIQAALDEVAGYEMDADGFRGALFLEAGEYEIKGTIYVNGDGVILRGAGDDSDPAQNTILRATGNNPDHRSVIVAGGGSSSKWNDYVPGTLSYIDSDTVLVGERSFRVTSTSGLDVGDNIIIHHKCTDAWLQSIDYGGTHSDMPDAEPGVDEPWDIGSQPILYNRYITAIEGKTITIDAPVFNHLIKSLSQAYLYQYKRVNLKTHIGIENLRVDIEAASDTDESHAWNAIELVQVEDGWVRDCTMLHFGLSGVITHTATRVTVENCNAIDPASVIEGGKRYNFNVYTASQLILFKNCHASNGRHHYMSNGNSYTSGIVFLDCTSSGAYASSEGHRRWSQGLLFDNHVEEDGPRAGVNPRLLGLYNRGYYGTSHGWSSVHSVAWNTDVANGDLIVQKPPTGQNYAIGCSGGNVTGIKPPASFDEPEGYIEGTNQGGLHPRSLYLAQLEDRKNQTNISGEYIPTMPADVVLQQNYPNPFNPSTRIAYKIPAAGQVRLIVFDLAGRKVSTLVSAEQTAGYKIMHWDGRDDFGKPVASGIYIYRLTYNGRAQSKRMLLMR